MRLPLIIVASLLLAACGGVSTVRDTVGGGYVDLVGATVELHQALPVAAERARVFVQDGRAVSGFDHYRAHCAFEIRSVDHGGTSIAADNFRIVGVQQTLQQVVAVPDPSTRQLAAVGLAFGMFGLDSPYYYMGYHFTLHTDKQPEVMRMTCFGAYAAAYEVEPPTLGEIRAALGELATIVR